MSEQEPELGDDDEDFGKKKQLLKKDRRPWESIAKFTKGGGAVHAAEEIKHLIYKSAKNFMEDSGLTTLSTYRPKPTDLHMWKQKKSWSSGVGHTAQTTIYQCPLKSKFGCPCEFKVMHMINAAYVEKRGVHDESCHAPGKDKSKFLKLHQIEAIRSGVVITPKQSAEHPRRNRMHASPEKRIPPAQPELARSIERHVKAKLTENKLDGDATTMFWDDICSECSDSDSEKD